MKKYLSAIFCLSILVSSNCLFAQAPTISYSSPQSYNVGTAITPLAPTSSGVATPGFGSPVNFGPPGHTPYLVATDAQGYVYELNYGSFNGLTKDTVQKISLAGNAAVVIASGLNDVRGMTVDAAGNVYLTYANQSNVDMIAANGGGIVNIASNLGTSSSYPFGIAVDAIGNIYVADEANNVIKKIFPSTGITRTWATGFFTPRGLALDAAGNLYVADSGTGAIKRIPAGGGSPVTISIGLANPQGIAVDAEGNIYVADQTVIDSYGGISYDVIKKIPAGGGNPVTISGQFFNTNSITVDPSGNVYVAAFGDLLSGKFGTVQEIKLSGGYFINPALPAGLIFDNTTGIISGTPTTVSLATNYTITAYNSIGSASATTSIQVIPPRPGISYSSPQSYNVGAPITPLVPASSNVAPRAYGSPFSIGAGFSSPTGVAADAAGNLFVADASNGAIKKIPAGTSTAVLVNSGYASPHGVAVDAAGNIYIADYGHNAVAKLRLIGTSYSYAGAIGSGFLNPTGVAVDAAGNVFVADFGNNAIKKIPQGGGVPVTIGSGFFHPTGVAVDGAGNVYVADFGNKAVKKVPANGGSVVVLSKAVTSPYGVAVDAFGNVFVADQAGNAIRVIPPGGGTVTTFATGFSGPTGVALDSFGNVIVANQLNNAVDEIGALGGYYVSPALPTGITFDQTTGIFTGTPTAASPARNYTVTAYNTYGYTTATVNLTTFSPAPAISYNSPVSFLAGVPVSPLGPASTGGAVAAPGYSISPLVLGSGFSGPSGVAVDASGNVYVADYLHALVKMIPVGGGAPVVLGSGFVSPYGVAVDAYGNVYVADLNFTTIKKIPAGNGPVVDVGSGFNNPSGVAVDAAGNVYVSDVGNFEIKKIQASNGVVSIMATNVLNPYGLTVDASGNIYYAESYTNSIKRVPGGGGGTPVVLGSGFNAPGGVAVDGAGNVYVADYGNSAVKEIPAGQNTPIVIGSGFFHPAGVAIDAAGRVFVADQDNSAVKRIDPVGGYYVSPGLPAGLKFNDTTGYITGTPTMASAAANYTVTAYNASAAASATVNIGVIFDLGLSSLTISAGTLSPSFTSVIPNYTDHIYNVNNPVTVTPTAIDPVATITVNNVAVASGTASAPISLNVASNTITIIVSAPGTIATSTYTIKLILPTPTLSYNSPNTYPAGIAITPLKPTSTYIAANGYSGIESVVASAVVRPIGVAVDLPGNVYIGKSGSSSLLKIPAGGGTAVAYGSGFSGPVGVATDAAGDVYVADYTGHAVKEIPAGGGTPVTIGSGFSGPYSVAVDAAGNVYVADFTSSTITKIPAGGGTQVILGSGFLNPTGVAVDAPGNVYVADEGNNAIKEIPVGGGAPVIIGSGFSNARGVAVDASGNLFIADSGHGRVVELPAGGGAQVVLGSGFSLNAGVAIDQYGVVYMSDFLDNIVYATKPSGGYYIGSALPAGLNFSNTTGAISGSPTTVSPASNYTVTAYNQGGNVSTAVSIAVTSSAALSALQLSSGTLTPVFASGTTSYTASVGNGTSSMTVTPTASDANATITVNGTAVTSGTASASLPLVVGPNTITTIVTAKDGVSTKTYKITLTRAPSSNDNLSAIKLSPTTALTVVAGADYKDYTASVANATSSVQVIPTTLVTTSTVTVNGVAVASGTASAAIPLNVGANVITTIVTAEDGVSTHTYVITVTRAPSPVATLSALVLSSGTLSPAFAAATTAYTASVANTITTITVTPTTTNTAATVTVNSTTVTSGTASASIPLIVGPNTLSISVTAQDGVTVKTYTITVTRAPSNNDNLSSIKLIPATPITAVAGPDYKDYTASVTYATGSVQEVPTAAVTTSTITVNGVAVASGATSNAIPLNVGANTITTVVTAQDGVSTHTYVITVTRAAGPIANALNTAVSVSNPTDHPQMMGEEITVHMGLSPNGDGINDFLLIDGITNYPDNKLQIMNRSGQLIFEAKGYDNSTKVFDGHNSKNGAMQLPGTYFYSLDFTVNGIAKHKTGFLVLKY